MEKKHLEDMKTMQFEMEYMRQKRMLDDMTIELEREKANRQKEQDHALWLAEQRQQLQQIKMQQAIAKEQRLLDLQKPTEKQRGRSDQQSIYIEAGVAEVSVPLDITRSVAV
jgi:hypothetical protein